VITTNTAHAVTSTGLTHAVLVSRMNLLCGTANARIREIKSSFKANEIVAALIGTLTGAVAVAREVDPQLEALHPSAADAEAFDRYLEALRQQRGLQARLIAAARAEETEAVREVESDLQTNSKARISAAIDLGAQGCGQP
jgi:hypothetical protein